MIKIQDIMRAGHIKRWNIINTSREQTLAEHLFNVAAITQTICDRCGVEDHIAHTALEWALIHDIPEVVCGDIPSPTKKRMLEMGMDMEEVYKSIDPTYAKIKKEAHENGAEVIVKLADLVESVKFLKENGVGRHAKMVCYNLSQRMWRYARALPPYLEEAATVVEDVIDGQTFE